MKPLTVEQVIRLGKIARRTRKKRIKKKIYRRISKATFIYFDRWLHDEEAHKTVDRTSDGHILMPSTKELIQRYS